MKSPLDVLKEANKRKKLTKIETPLDLIRYLNKEKKRKATTQRILKHFEYIA